MRTLKYYFNVLKRKKEQEKDSSISTKNINDSFNYLSKRLHQKERLFFVRFGDGEFLTLLKQDHRNYIYNEGLDNELEESFKIKDPNFLIACPINYPYDEYHAKGIYKRFSWQDKMINLLDQKQLYFTKSFENACIFQCMAIFRPKKFKNFLTEHIRHQKKMFIGSTDKATTESLYGKIDYYINIPKKDAYETIDKWWPEVDLIIPSAGSTSNAIAVRLWNLNYQGKLIDFGSIVDAASLISSRTWIRLQGHKILKVLDPKPKLTYKQKFKFYLKDIKFYFRNQII